MPQRGRILEIGCGRGENCSLLHSLRPDLEIHGLDWVRSDGLPKFIHFVRHDLQVGPLPYPDFHFQAILFIHVLEHLRNPNDLCAEIYRLLTPGGQIYVEAPNYTSCFVPSFGFRRHQHHPFNFFDDLEHRRPYTKQALFEFVEQCGLRVEKVGNTRNWRRWPFDLLALPWAVISGDRPQLVRRFWNLYGWCIYAIGAKK